MLNTQISKRGLFHKSKPNTGQPHEETTKLNEVKGIEKVWKKKEKYLLQGDVRTNIPSIREDSNVNCQEVEIAM